jgi:glycolate oxidase iron-sulfur subunit
VQSACFSRVNQATVSVLTAEGCEVTVPPGLGCCGALSLHAGRLGEAQRLVKQAIAELEKCEFDALVVSSAGCGSAMKHWSRLLDGQPEWVERARKLETKVRDLSEWLVQLGPRAPRRRLGLRVAYHDACHLGHGQGVRAEPRQLLASIEGLTLLEIPDADQCCGSGGVYNLLEPEAAELIGARKVDQVLSVQPEVIVSANPGCTLQLERGLKLRGVDIEILHPAELLARALGPVPARLQEPAGGAQAPRPQRAQPGETEGPQAW